MSPLTSNSSPTCASVRDLKTNEQQIVNKRKRTFVVMCVCVVSLGLSSNKFQVLRRPTLSL